MSFFGNLVGIAAPIIGGFFGGPVGAAIGGAIGGAARGGGLKGAAEGGALGFLGGEVASGFGGALGGAAEGAGGVTPPNPFAFGAGTGISEGFANPFDEFGQAASPGVAPPNPLFTAGNGGAGIGGLSGFQQRVAQLFQTGGLGNLGGAASKFGLPLFQTIGGIDSLIQGRKLQRQAQLPNPADVASLPGYQAGLEAVQRSMASQGYQGSGNMATALLKYGGDAYNQAVGQRINSADAQAGGVVGQLSGLALLSQGARGLAGAF